MKCQSVSRLGHGFRFLESVSLAECVVAIQQHRHVSAGVVLEVAPVEYIDLAGHCAMFFAAPPAEI